MVSLDGVIDLHIHSAPDVPARLMDDLALARQAAAAGMRAILLKSHHMLTADRAIIAQQIVPGIRVYGGLALNRPVGGLNPAAVEVALAMGAREIWMPTLSAAGPNNDQNSPVDGIGILLTSGRLVPAVHEILRLIAERDAILGTGHLSVLEIRQLVLAARATGVRRILITHPDSYLVAMPVAVQLELRGPDVLFERCYLDTLPHPERATLPLATLAGIIREVGVASTVLSTDLGQAKNSAPVDGMCRYIDGLIALGFSQADIDRMARANPASLLGL